MILHNFKRAQDSPRTLYNGPFVLPKHKTPPHRTNPFPSPSWARSLTPSSSKTVRPEPSFPHPGHLFSPTERLGANACSQTGQQSPSRVRPLVFKPKQSTPKSIYRASIATPRSDDGCRPVYSLSFLNDSNVSGDLLRQNPTHNISSTQPFSPHGIPFKSAGNLSPFRPSPRTSHSSSIGASIESKAYGFQQSRQVKDPPNHLARTSSPLLDTQIRKNKAPSSPQTSFPFAQYYRPPFSYSNELYPYYSDYEYLPPSECGQSEAPVSLYPFHDANVFRSQQSALLGHVPNANEYQQTCPPQDAYPIFLNNLQRVQNNQMASTSLCSCQTQDDHHSQLQENVSPHNEYKSRKNDYSETCPFCSRRPTVTLKSNFAQCHESEYSVDKWHAVPRDIGQPYSSQYNDGLCYPFTHQFNQTRPSTHGVGQSYFSSHNNQSYSCQHNVDYSPPSQMDANQSYPSQHGCQHMLQPILENPHQNDRCLTYDAETSLGNFAASTNHAHLREYSHICCNPHIQGYEKDMREDRPHGGIPLYIENKGRSCGLPTEPPLVYDSPQGASSDITEGVQGMRGNERMTHNHKDESKLSLIQNGPRNKFYQHRQLERPPSEPYVKRSCDMSRERERNSTQEFSQPSAFVRGEDAVGWNGWQRHGAERNQHMLHRREFHDTNQKESHPSEFAVVTEGFSSTNARAHQHDSQDNVSKPRLFPNKHFERRTRGSDSEIQRRHQDYITQPDVQTQRRQQDYGPWSNMQTHRRQQHHGPRSNTQAQRYQQHRDTVLNAQTKRRQQGYGRGSFAHQQQRRHFDHGRRGRWSLPKRGHTSMTSRSRYEIAATPNTLSSIQQEITSKMKPRHQGVLASTEPEQRSRWISAKNNRSAAARVDIHGKKGTYNREYEQGRKSEAESVINLQPKSSTKQNFELNCGVADQKQPLCNAALGSGQSVSITKNDMAALDRFISDLKRFPAKINSIQTLHNCATSCRFPIKISYTTEELEAEADSKDAAGFTVAVFINGKFIARRSGESKRGAKHLAYDETLSVLLRSQPAQGLASVVDPLAVSWSCDGTQDVVDPGRGDDDTVSPDLHGDVRLKAQDKMEGTMPLEVITNEPAKEEKGPREEIDSAVHAAKEDEVGAICQTDRLDRVRRNEGWTSSQSSRQMTKKTDFMFMDQTTIWQLERLIRDIKIKVKDSGVKDDEMKANNVWIVDKHCVKSKLKLLAIYKGIHQPLESLTITCDLYLCERFIAQGRGTNRKLAQAHAYKRACEVLKSMTKAGDIMEFLRLDESEFKQPEIIDIVHKGYQVVEESNLCRLNRIKQPPVEKRNLSDFIILEHEDWSRDRKKHAHCILAQSATQCGCLLEWRSEPSGRSFRCTMSLQGEQVASCVTRLRKEAVRVASVIALFTFYETQPVVQGFHIDYPAVWTPRDRLIEMATTAKACLGAADRLELMEEDGKVQVDEKMAAAIELTVEEFSRRETLEVVVCAPDWRTEEKRHLRSVAAGKGLRVVTENYCEDQVLVVSHKHSLLEIYEILQKQPSKAQGRYRVLRDEERPCYMDVAGEIAANESMVREQQVTLLDTEHLSREARCFPAQILNKRRFMATEVNSAENRAPCSKETCTSGEEMRKEEEKVAAGCLNASSPGKKDPLKNKGVSRESQRKTVEVEIHSGADKLDEKASKCYHSYKTAHCPTENIESSDPRLDSERQRDHCLVSSSDDSDVFVTANNTMDGANLRDGEYDRPQQSESDIISPNETRIVENESPSKFPHPRITSTPSSHHRGELNTSVHLGPVQTVEKAANANRVLAFSEANTRNELNSSLQRPVSSSCAGGGLEKEHNFIPQKPLVLSQSLSTPSTLPPSSSPSDPSSARLTNSQSLSIYHEGQDCTQLSCEIISKEMKAKKEESQRACLIHRQHRRNPTYPLTFEESQVHPAQERPQAHLDQKPQLQRRRRKLEDTIDVEACLRSPEQRAVCILIEGGSQCVRFSSEFVTCDETKQD